MAQLERELGRLQSELATWQPLKARCEEAHSVHEKVSFPRRHLFCGRGKSDRLSRCLKFIDFLYKTSLCSKTLKI